MFIVSKRRGDYDWFDNSRPLIYFSSDWSFTYLVKGIRHSRLLIVREGVCWDRQQNVSRSLVAP